MSVFFTDFCPICQNPLKNTTTISTNGRTCTLYQCDNYFYSQDAETKQPIYASTSLTRFYLKFVDNQTHVFLFDYDKDNQRYYKSYKFLGTFPNHFNIDWQNLNQLDERLYNLLVFL